MKKLGLVLVLSSMLLSGCTATNGILTSQDVRSVDKEHLEQLIKKQRNVYTTSEDVQKMIDRINAIKTDDLEGEEDGNYIENNRIASSHSRFEIEGSLSENSNDNYFKKCVDILDETVAGGIKKYINSFSKEDISKNGPQSAIIGRASVYVFADSYRVDKVDDNIYYVNIKVNLGDVRDKTYANLIDNIRSKDFLLQDIEVGKYQDLIKISNVPYINNLGHRVEESKARVSYELFIDNDKKEIKKVKLMIVKQKGSNIKESNMYSLKNIASIMKFDTKDFKVLEDMTDNINKDMIKTKGVSTEKFNFRYKGTRTNYKYSDEGMKENNLIEITIENK